MNQTRPTDSDVDAFLAAVENPVRQADAWTLCELLTELSGEPPTMWGPSMIGFGQQHYAYESGREGDWFLVGFSPRKTALTIYLTDGMDGHADELARLGRHKLGKGCLYVTKLADVDGEVLHELLTASIANAKRQAAADR